MTRPEFKYDLDSDNLLTLQIAYEFSKYAPVNEEATCPVCKLRFVKSQPDQAFCNVKEPGQSRCKDRYWTMISPTRRERISRRRR